MKVFIRALGYGVASYMPWIGKRNAKGTGGTVSARYCYSVWLRHLVMAKENGLNTHPKVIAELGPGDSLGIGLAALISGSDKCFAFDIVEHANIERNLAIFDELVMLFRNRSLIPGDDEFPRVKPRLDNYIFPSDILDETRLHDALESSRLKRIRDSIMNVRGLDSMIQYKVPWYDSEVLEKESVDMIYSQAVLEHVDALESAYEVMSTWLKPTGYISHTIDFKCHGTADQWNGHWRYSDFVWKLIRGKRPYILNREPHSTHIKLLNKVGFNIVCDKKSTSTSVIKVEQLAQKFRSMTSDDMETSGVFIQAAKT